MGVHGVPGYNQPAPEHGAQCRCPIRIFVLWIPDLREEAHSWRFCDVWYVHGTAYATTWPADMAVQNNAGGIHQYGENI